MVVDDSRYVIVSLWFTICRSRFWLQLPTTMPSKCACGCGVAVGGPQVYFGPCRDRLDKLGIPCPANAKALRSKRQGANRVRGGKLTRQILQPDWPRWLSSRCPHTCNKDWTARQIITPLTTPNTPSRGVSTTVTRTSKPYKTTPCSARQTRCPKVMHPRALVTPSLVHKLLCISHDCHNMSGFVRPPIWRTVLVWWAEQIAEALAGLYRQKLVDGLTLPEIIAHNEGILRLARNGVDI